MRRVIFSGCCDLDDNGKLPEGVCQDMELITEEPYLLHILAGFAALAFLAIVMSPFVVRFRRPGGVDIADRTFFCLLIGIGISLDYSGIYCKLFTEVWEQGSEFIC